MKSLNSLVARFRPLQLLITALALVLIGSALDFYEADGFAMASFAAAVTIGALGVRKTALKLVASQAQIQALLAPVEDVILMLDRDGRYLNIAPTNPSLLVRPPSELVGKYFHEVLSADTAALFLEQVHRTLAQRQNVNFDYDLLIGSRTVCFSATLSPVDENTVVWVARDITARKLTERALQQANEQLEAHVAERTAELSRTVDALHAEVVRRRHAEGALRRSEESYRNIIEQASDITCTLTAAGTIASLNAAFERTLGYRVTEWIGRPFIELIPTEERRKVIRAFKRAFKAGGQRLTRNIVRASDGSRVILESALVPQRTDGVVTGFLCVARDVTVRDHDEDMLRQSERQLAESQRIARLGSWVANLETNEQLWSDEYYRILGIDPARTPSFETALAVMDEASHNVMLQACAALEQSESHQWDVDVRLSDGTRKSLHYQARLEKENGRRTRIVGIVQDVTESRRAEQRLRESEERFRFVARATNDAVWDHDLTTGKVWWSDGFSHLFGHEKTGDSNRQHWLERVHPEDQARVEQGLREAIESGQESWSDEYRFRRSDGSYAVAFDRGYIVRDANRRAIRVTGAMADLTERKLLEEQLAHTRRVNSLGRVAASIAHEFNNVLMGIQPNLEVIRRRANLAEVCTPLEHVLQSVQRGKRVTDEILRFTRPSPPQLECVNVSSLIRGWETEIRAVLGGSIALDIHCEVDDLFMAADSLQMTQVLTNLAVNARDAMPDGGTLQIHAEIGKSFASYGFGVVKTPDGYVHIRVTDTGTGMTRDQLSHVFEPLFTTKRGGTGLGLAISYQLVTRHGGQMFVESEPGLGTTFHVLVPATHPSIETAKHPELTRVSLAIRRFVIVEDEPAVASGLKTLLEMDGASVDVVATGNEAMGAIERFEPDVVVLDIGLPDIDGTEVYAQIEKRWPQMPVLFSSGHADAARLEHLLSRSNLGLLLKPYEFDTFRRALDPLMRASTMVM